MATTRAHGPAPTQPCKWPLALGGWWALIAGREECGQFHVLPTSLPANAGGHLGVGSPHPAQGGGGGEGWLFH